MIGIFVMNQLSRLIVQPYDAIHNRIVELKVCPSLKDCRAGNINIENRFFYPAINCDGYSTEEILAKDVLSNSIMRFSLSGMEYEKYRDHVVSGHAIEAEKIRKSAYNRFKRYKEESVKNAGEIGELALFVILEAFFRAPKIASKMRLKTSSEVHVHGADAIHAILDDENILTLFLGESKFRKNRVNAENEALNSLKTFIDTYGKVGREIEIACGHITNEIFNEDLRNRIIDYFGTFTPESNQIRKSIVVFLGYDKNTMYKDLDKIAADDRTSELERRFEKHANKSVAEFCKKLEEIASDHWKHIKFFYVLLPFQSTEEVKKIFYSEAGLLK